MVSFTNATQNNGGKYTDSNDISEGRFGLGTALYAGGGGGYYGGAGSFAYTGGGSGYIANNSLNNKSMYCFFISLPLKC